MRHTVTKERRSIDATIIAHLQESNMLVDVSPDELYLIASYGKRVKIEVQQARKPLAELEDRFVFVAKGIFESVFVPDKEVYDIPERAAVLKTLTPGMHWGDHFLIGEQESQQREKLMLRCSGVGELISFSALQIKAFIDQMPGFRIAFFNYLLVEQAHNAMALGQSMVQLEDRNAVLNRIESVADTMILAVTGSSEGDKDKAVIQRKFLLDKAPELKDQQIETTSIEQAYLSSSTEKEDRIRRAGRRHTRTTKYGSGIKRTTLEREISAPEYTRLLEEVDGGIIKKQRHKFAAVPAGSKKMVLDIFENGERDTPTANLAGLFLLEVDFANEQEAKSFQVPDWLGQARDVTNDKAYSNRNLATKGRP